MSKLLAVCSDDVSGGTFLCWSLEYLTGRDAYWGYHGIPMGSAGFHKLIDNPIIRNNSHNFVSNEYGFSYKNKPTAQQFVDGLQEHDSHVYIHKCTQESMQAVQNTSSHVFRLVNDAIYQFHYERRHHDSEFKSNDELMLELFDEKYFKETLTGWDTLETFWDRREFIALAFKPFDNKLWGPYQQFDCTKPHFTLHAHDLYNHFDNTVKHCLDYTEQTIDIERWNNWKDVWIQWRKIHESRTIFQSYLDTIIEYTISGNYMDLTRFNLDIFQQAVVLYQLKHKHGLSIKGYEVEEFTDTLQLHSLLEVHQYNLENVYE